MVKEFRDPPPEPRQKMPSAPPAKPEQRAHADILLAILHEQRQTNQLLSVLIKALADDYSEPDAEPQTYMDGTPV